MSTHKSKSAKAKPVKLLSGGNPQIPKGDGDGPVQQYIEAMPGWKSEVGRQLDKLIEANIPEVQKAVRWNSPFFGTKEIHLNVARVFPCAHAPRSGEFLCRCLIEAGPTGIRQRPKGTLDQYQ